MSECMTIADETVDQKDICIDIAPKDIAEIILEEALLSALIVSDKGCSRIGDSNITDEFRQQYDQLSNLKDFEQVEPSQTQPAANKDSNFNFRENSDRACSIPAKENLEQIIDFFVKKEEKIKPVNEYQEISEVLADNELQIKNGQIYIEKNKTEKESARKEYFEREDVIKDEKIEIEYFDKGQLNKIYVPLNSTKSETNGTKLEDGASEEKENESNEKKSTEDAERPFKPCTTEDLRQSTLRVWENGNSSFVGLWDDGLMSQREKVVKIMEELSSAQVYPDSFVDPNRPRAYAFGEEDVNKMTKEIEGINFNQGHSSSDSSVSNHPENQDQSVLKSDNIDKSQSECNTLHVVKNNLEKDEMLLTKEDNEKNSLIPPNTTQNPEEQNQTCDINKTQSNPHMDDTINTKNSELITNLKTESETLKDPDLTPDLGVKQLQDNPSPSTKPRNVSEPVEILKSHQTQQDTLEWNGLTWENKEIDYTSNNTLNEKHWKEILMDYNPITGGTVGKVESKEGDNFLQEPLILDERKSSVGIMENGEDTDSIEERTSDRLTKTLIFAEKNVENFEKIKEKPGQNQNIILQEEIKECSTDGGNIDFTQTIMSAHSSQKNLNCEDDTSNTESNQEIALESETSLMQVKSTHETEQTEDLVSGSQKFKLHSPKMYLITNNEPAGQMSNDFNLTDSEEAFIDLSENIIQIINPQENSTDEDSNEISFSLVSESSNIKCSLHKASDKSELSLKLQKSSEIEIPAEKVFSGMTTIGPIKNIDYDPKSLSPPEVDYGKMTRITSSRQLARDMGLLNSENPVLSVKIIEEDDSDDDTSLNLEEDHSDRNSLVKRDIASLTKVQKVREVISNQVKPDEDFEDEESLPRPRLDLKDVESITDERYKFPDISIPLLSFDIGDRNLDAEKELIETMDMVISGLANAFYEEEMDENTETQISIENSDNPTDVADTKIEEEISRNKAEETSEEFESREKVLEETQNENPDNLKYSTLGNVFRKASSKFLKKDSEVYMRNSKSLPRDTNKITATNSIRSILDDCQSSATNVLKKSCSLLKNTESIFKSISQSMVSTDRNSGSSTTQKKLSPSESDVSTIERKFSGFFKKEEFTKAKNLIKNKVEKTFRNFDNERPRSREPEISSDKEDVRVVVRNEENFRIDRIENFKKLLPKSPLVYKSQFVRSQMDFQTPPEPETEPNHPVEIQDMNYPPDRNSIIPLKEKGKIKTLSHHSLYPHKETQLPESQEESAKPIDSYPKENLQWIIQKDNLQLPMIESIEPTQPDYIVMETIQGLPASDLESPSSEKENLNLENSNKQGKSTPPSMRYKPPYDARDYFSVENEPSKRKIESSNSHQMLTSSSHDVTPRFPDTEDEKTVTKTPSSERKIKTKKKKFTARFRSFWCSAFGRVKTPEKKYDLS